MQYFTKCGLYYDINHQCYSDITDNIHNSNNDVNLTDISCEMSFFRD